MNGDYIKYLENLVETCKLNKVMTLGTEDFVAGLCNTLEKYTYLLQQRVKETVNLGVVTGV